MTQLIQELLSLTGTDVLLESVMLMSRDDVVQIAIHLKMEKEYVHEMERTLKKGTGYTKEQLEKALEPVGLDHFAEDIAKVFYDEPGSKWRDSRMSLLDITKIAEYLNIDKAYVREMNRLLSHSTKYTENQLIDILEPEGLSHFGEDIAAVYYGKPSK